MIVLKTRAEVQERVCELVAHFNGLKPMDLIPKLTEEERMFITGQFLEEMVMNNQLLELEYTQPNDPDAVHSFLLPTGTQVNARFAAQSDEAPAAKEDTLH